MAQIFHPSFNTISKASIVASGVLALAAVGYAALEFNRAPYVTQVQMERDQPVPFSHEHHVGGVGIDCRRADSAGARNRPCQSDRWHRQARPL